MKIITIKKDTLPEAWEEAVIQCWDSGDLIQTQYDKQDDEPSTDVLAIIHVAHPMAEPRFHRAFPGSLEDLEIYRNEVILGVHDYYMDDVSNPHRWMYTYHQRMSSHNQIENCIKKLSECSYSRRAKIGIWDVDKDSRPDSIHPPCLQEMLFRIENGKLNMNCVMRSSDAYKASFMNMYAFIEFQKYMADRLEVSIGEFVFIAHSYHIYGSYFKEFYGFLQTIKDRPFSDRVWNTDVAIPMFIEGCDRLLLEEKIPANTKKMIMQRKLVLSNL